MCKTKQGTILFLGCVLGLFLHRSIDKVDAAPADVRGSDNTAVETFRTETGTYILWASGRITNPETPGKEYGLQYEASGFQTASARKGAPKGSPNVAVGTVSRKDGVLVLFADGTLKKPTDFKAQSTSATPERLLRGTVSASGGRVAGDGFESQLVSQNVFRINFDTPFKTKPSVAILTHRSTSGAQQGLRLVLPIRQSITKDYFEISTHTWQGYPGEWAEWAEPFDFIVAGE